MPERLRDVLASSRLPAVLLLAGWTLAALGIWGAWVTAQPAGLRVLGIDLAEYVKFVWEVRSGQLTTTREVFLLPLAALSLSMSLLAHRRELGLPAWLGWTANLLAVPVALSMLPPAWTPALLRTPEFVKQTAAIALCLTCALLAYPLLRRLPLVASAVMSSLLAAASIVLPLISFVRLTPALAAIYGHPVSPSAAPLLLATGFVLTALAPFLALRRR